MASPVHTSYGASKDLILVHIVQTKPIIPQEEWSLVDSEKTHLKKLMIMIIIFFMNKSQETTVFSGRQKLTSVMKLRPEK